MSDVGSGILGFVGLSALAGVLVTAAVTPALAVTGLAANNSISMFENLPGYLDIGELSEKTDIYATAADGTPIHLASFFDENREEVPWDSISQYVKDAAIAGEDPRFYEHGGVDLQGTIRGALSTYVLNQDVQGGSSITQQYVKNVLINNGVREAKTEEEKDAAYAAATETSPERKLKEMRYAIALEKKFSKDDILLGYLNIAAFGGRVYGIESAAQYYFGKTAATLTLAEAASLIAIVNHPEKFRLDRPDSETNGAATVVDGQPVPYAENKQRRDYILEQMLKETRITQEEYDVAVATPVAPVITEPSTGCQSAGGSAFFCDYVTWVIKNNYDDPTTEDVNEGVQMLQQGGLQVFTTLDLDLQAAAEAAMTENVPYWDDRFDVGSSAVTVQPGTGRILAMAQNKIFSNDPDVLASSPVYSAVNYATDYEYGGSSGFQPGSTYKVWTLAEWLNAGHSLSETFNGSRRTFTSFTDSCEGNWSGSFNPRNDDGTNANNAVNATKYSVNTAFMAMAEQLDLCKIKQTAQAFGMHRADGLELQMNPSDVLGTQELAPLTMAAGFAGIANNGMTCTPIAIDRIINAKGEDITPPASTCTQSVTPEVAHAMAYAMEQTFNGGTADASNTGTGVAHLGKTGTTDNAVDTWMVGSSTTAATAVWVGNVTGGDNRTNLRNVSFDSGSAATARHRIWPWIMETADNKYGGEDFPEPDASAFRQVMVDIPQVVGLSLDAAKQALEDAGFVFEDGGQQDSNLPAGTVTGTDPSGQAGRGSTIRVFTSNGNSNATTVPDLTGMNALQAKAALDAAGLKMKGGGGNPTAVVESQNPAPGTPAKRGDDVTVNFGGGGGPGNGNDSDGD
ncbi:transglycosylase domain-containing protein [Agromyces sp. Marseille-P2726]|uniref:transglycosylase domain-containing protein n=1 Tax=Agromyces sp. Marseille-P2726 TaxID=2709132 RepID=UPI0020C1CD4E|nr:transglycosylase domain-containing protein [Agromyces sp. Marseille-P2726]